MAMPVGVMMELLAPQVADITAEGLSLVGEATAEELGLTEVDAALRGPISVSLDLMQADDMIAVTGVVEGTVARQCVRCLKEFDDAMAFAVHAAFAREGRQPKAPARQTKTVEPRKGRANAPKDDAETDGDDEGDDRYFYQGDHVDLAPMLREHIILAAPMQPLCRIDCAGLCARCGADLNEGRCPCPPEPPVSAIRVIKSTKH